MKLTFNISICIVFLTTVLFEVSEARQLNQEPEVSQIFRNIAELNDPASIQIIFNDFFITENIDQVDRIEIIDVSDIGFGSNDILVVYPSRNVYMLDQPSPQLAETMRSWSIREQRRDAENTLSADYFYPAHADTLERWEVEESEIVLVQNALISDILESLDRNYTDMPISLRFERGELDEGFTFQMWNYSDDAFSFSPRPARSDSIAVNDFLYVLYSDSTIVADTTLYDIIYINKSVQEIIYLPPISEDSTIRTHTLPGANAFDLSVISAITRRDNDY